MGDGQGGSGAARDTLTAGTVLENEKRFMGLTGVSLFPLKGGPRRYESQGGSKEAREPGWEACPGNFTTWTPHLPPPSTQGAPPHTPGPLGSHTHTHTHTLKHTHSTCHTPKGIRGPNPGKKFFTKVLGNLLQQGELDRVGKKQNKPGGTCSSTPAPTW